MRPLSLLAAVSTMALVVACGGGSANPSPTSPELATGNPAPSAVPTPAPTEAATTATPPSPAATAPTLAAGSALVAGTNVLAGGEYSAPVGALSPRFTVDASGWVATLGGAGVGLGETNADAEATPHLLSLDDFAGMVSKDGCTPDDAITIKPTSAALIGWLRSNPHWTAGKATSTTLGGRPARQVDLTMDVPKGCGDPEASLYLWQRSDGSASRFDWGERVRVTAADAGHGHVLLGIAESGAALGHDDWIAKTQPILESVTLDK